ncbi:hypothetical protein SDC9_144228 [bioreactor metagenome]|uniref:Uncharacterized protein n=1 Tax=bioreactor metagenome TaxID=1076179 RepID=A0A645E6C5_9ZZZZ
MLYSQLIAVGLPDGPGLIGPLVPNLRVQVADIVRLLLPDPQKLVHRRLPIGAPQRQNRELRGEVIAVYNAEFFDGMGGSPVLPMRPDLLVRVPDAVLQDVPAILKK